MPSLTERDKRTLRMAAIAIAIYLVLFFGWRGWSRLEAKRHEYQRLVKEAQKVKQELQPYENKVLLLEKLKETFRFDPPKLSKATLVADASAAIQRAAQAGGIELGPIRESSARTAARELASMQIEGVGPVPATVSWLHRLETLGYPLILDSVQITPAAGKPGMVKMVLTVVILDFEQWKNEERRNA